MITQHNTTRAIVLLLFLVGVFNSQAQQEVLTKVNGGAQWEDANLSAAALNFTPSSGTFTYTTTDDDYTIIDENTSTTKDVELHSSSMQGKILIFVNRTSTAISFTGTITGYEGINGSTITSVPGNSSVKIQWDSGTSTWYEVVGN